LGSAIIICEDKWYSQLDAQIDMHSMILPRMTSNFCFTFVLNVYVFRLSLPVCWRFHSYQSQRSKCASLRFVSITTKCRLSLRILQLC